MKYGIESHIKKCKISDEPDVYLKKLLGRINYALSVSESEELIGYKKWIMKEIKK